VKVARVVLLLFFLASLGARAIAHRDPLIVRYRGHWYFPALRFYSGVVFEETDALTPDYRKLAQSGRIRALFPPIAYGPNDADETLAAPPPTAPDRRHWLGTDDRGRDVLVRLLYGMRVSFAFGLLTWAVSAVLGYAIGLVSGWRGGLVDLLGQRLVEITAAIPVLHVILFALCLFRPSLWLLTVLWTAFGWLPFAAYARAEALRVREELFVQSARASGIGGWRLFTRHLLPHTLSPLRALSPLVIGANIAVLAGLDFLGLGLPAPTASWGELLRQGRENPQAWWLLVFPLGALVAVLLALPFLRDVSREEGG